LLILIERLQLIACVSPNGGQIPFNNMLPWDHAVMAVARLPLGKFEESAHMIAAFSPIVPGVAEDQETIRSSGIKFNGQ
jgi:hypothetical protein